MITDITKRRRGRAPLDYQATCLDCDWEDEWANSTDSARRHAEKFDHHVACTVEREYHYEGRSK